MLDLLRLADIPAYLEPSTDPRVAARYPVSGPVERLYVRADQRQEARAVVVAAAHEAGESAETIAADAPPTPAPRSAADDVLDGIDTDAEFARIVSAFSGPSAPPPTVSDPVNRRGIDPADLILDPDPTDDELVTPAELDAAAEAAAQARFAAEQDAEFDLEAAEEEDDHFYPPPAPPFPVPTANTVGAVLLMILGILVLLRGDVFGLDSNTSFPASIILLLASSALIIRGLRDRPEPGEEPEDDGAEV